MSHHLIQISDCHIDDNEYSMGVNTHINLKKLLTELVILTLIYY